jgi:hypothetical protein
MDLQNGGRVVEKGRWTCKTGGRVEKGRWTRKRAKETGDRVEKRVVGLKKGRCVLDAVVPVRRLFCVVHIAVVLSGLR